MEKVKVSQDFHDTKFVSSQVEIEIECLIDVFVSCGVKAGEEGRNVG